MDAAYDHIAEKTYSGDRAQTPTPPKTSDETSEPAEDRMPISPKRESLQSEFQETFKAFSASPWGARLGGLWGNVQKQSQTYLETARKEAEAASGEALKGFTDLKDGLVKQTRSLAVGEGQAKEKTATAEEPTTGATPQDTDAAISENESFIARFRSEAAKRLKDVEKAEDAADEALLRFGTNVRNFLKEAVTVVPEEERPGTAKPSVLFDSTKPQEGTRSQDRRKELLKGKAANLTVAHLMLNILIATSTNPEEVGWDDDSDEDHPSTPHTSEPTVPSTPRAKQVQKVLESHATGGSETDTLRPEPRRSHDEKSIADSDASYDLVSGATSRAPGSPKEEKEYHSSGKNEDSEEEDWE